MKRKIVITFFTVATLLYDGYSQDNLLDLNKDGAGLQIPLSIRNFNGVNGDMTGIRFKSNAVDNDQKYKSGIFFERKTSQGRGSLHFATNNGDNTSNAGISDIRMTIDRRGYVGIGTTAPSELLQVKGITHIHNHVGGIKLDPVPSQSENGWVRSSILSSRDSDLEWDDINHQWTLGNGSNSNDFAAIVHRSGGELSFSTGTASAFSSLSNSAFRNQFERLTILGNGNVGIGTTTPDGLLDIENTNGSANLMVTGEQAKTLYTVPNEDILLATGTYKTSLSSAHTQYGLPMAGAAIFRTVGTEVTSMLIGSDSPVPIVFGNDDIERMRITSDGKVGVGYSSVPIGKGVVYVKGAVTAESGTDYGNNFITDRPDTGGYMSYLMKTAGTEVWSVGLRADNTHLGIYDEQAAIERLVIDTSGNVGIGTTSPDKKLDVAGAEMIFQDDNSVGNIFFKTNDGGIELTDGLNHMSYIDFRGKDNGGMSNGNNETDFKGRILYNDGHATAYSGTKGLFFQAGGGGYGMSLTEGGNVGIGTFQPGHKLDVAGTINATQVLVNGTPVSTGTTYWNETSGNISFSSGNVGIGNSSPDVPLSVGAIQNMGHEGNVEVKSNSSHFAVSLEENSGTERWSIGIDSEGDLNFHDSGITTPTITFEDGGNVGIGKTNPSYTLDVAGQSRATDFYRLTNVGSGGDGIIADDGAGSTIFSVTRNAGNEIRLQGYGDITFFNNGSSGSEKMRVATSGNVGIGTTNPTEKLSVNGTIRSKEVKVETSSWPDYVFEDDYNLRSLEEIEKFIKANNHLPEVPSAKEVEENGVELGMMNTLLLKKIEELTLYLLEQKEVNEALAKRIEKLEKN